MKEGILQRKWKLATIRIANRANPVHYTELADVPIETGRKFYRWYSKRS